ncbi:ABC transporter permease [Mucilaginibacter agri]|uniref:FtsX-like permease family protein n=1 Tax=Mucilaginibacter agri TaxID=2695265 RepID=A0A966DTT7_9SPHI|nr:ABC transporter permease [Mucilaginibacter agri]NCD69009.1 FtsX-like permease family protein [Mucilaginibacter agri]
MIKNNLKIAWRGFLRDRQFSFLNLAGLATGIACALLIYVWVSDQLSFDKFFANDDQLYQLMEQRGPDKMLSDESSGMLGETLILKVPEIKYQASVAPPDWFQKFTLSTGDKNIKASGQYAGKDYFNIFSFKLLEGLKDKVLADKNSIVISDELAKKLFNTTDNLVGKVIHFQHQTDFFISGVFEKTPYNSSQQFDFVLPFEYLKDTQPWVKSWDNTGPHNFVLLQKGTDIHVFNQKIKNVFRERDSNDSTRTAIAMKFSDNYLLNTFSHGAKVGSKVEYVKLFSLIAIFILVIACINFMNLSTAKASRRMKEVGVRKVVGAARSQLVIQFLTEALLITTFAVILAIGMAFFLLPQFNLITGRDLSLHFNLQLVISLIAITLFTGVLSGSYPALYLSKFSPLTVLKNKVHTSFSAMLSRKGLVVFQFTVSVILIISVFIIYQQVQYIQSTSPGYNKDNVIRFDSEGRLQGTEETFIDQLKTIPGVVNATFTLNNVVGRNFATNGLDWEGKGNKELYFEGFGGGPNFIETMNMKMASGRSFSKNYGDEDNKIIINEAGVAAMHLQNPVGKNVRLFGQPKQIIGVVKDFHFESLHETVKPAYVQLVHQGNNPWYKIMVRIKPGDQKETIERIGELYQNYNIGFPFTYGFLDEAYQKQYEAETRVATLSRYFSGLAILISCLGLFGLAAFTAQRRQKEIGIRKVIGASVSGITMMLSKEFLKLVLISLLFAFPISWWLMHNWLLGFAYRIHISALVFVAAGVAIILITLVTVSYQSIKAALINPVKSLRSE